MLLNFSFKMQQNFETLEKIPIEYLIGVTYCMCLSAEMNQQKIK